MTQDTASKEQLNFLRFGLKSEGTSYRPRILQFSDESLRQIFKDHRPVFHDFIHEQVKGLLKIRNPQLAHDPKALASLYDAWINTNDPQEYGVYVYYPWSNRLVHLLPEEEFIELRTSRNQHKITFVEQQELRQKCVGIIGLSVGQSVAVTMALERSCGTLKLADFDELELSNLNRIRTGVHNLGLSKTVIAAREISEIDPFLKIELFNEGINSQNIDAFLDDAPRVDILIEECDDLKMKIESRKAARSRKIPVLMDTSDRGMLDVERFDLEDDRPLLHGLVPDLDQLEVNQLQPEQKIQVLLKLVGGLNISDRLKASLLELNQSIGSWPQLSSSVNLGAGFAADVARRILLGKEVLSGRYYADTNQLVRTKESADVNYEAPAVVSSSEMSALTRKYSNFADVIPEEELISKAVEMASLAPSSGNDQPWMFYYSEGVIGVFHHIGRAYSFGDFNNYASYQSVGSAIQNLSLFLASKGYEANLKYLPEGDDSPLLAILSFSSGRHKNEKTDAWVNAIPDRHTNREITEKKEIAEELLSELTEAIGAFPDLKLQWITDVKALEKQGRIIAECDRLRVFDHWGHRDFFHREMRWTPQQAEEQRDGIDIRSLGIAPENMLGLQILRNFDVVTTLADIDGGQAFDAISMDAAKNASAMGLLYGPDLSSETLIRAGQAWENIWLSATEQNIAFHPLVSPLYLLNRLNNGGRDHLDPRAVEKLKDLAPEFESIWNIGNGKPLFMFRIFCTDKRPVKSLRLSMDKIYFKDGQ